jgi:hypothetical protein
MAEEILARQDCSESSSELEHFSAKSLPVSAHCENHVAQEFKEQV